MGRSTEAKAKRRKLAIARNVAGRNSMANTASQLPVACHPEEVEEIELQRLYDDMQDSLFYIDEHQRVLDGLDQYAAVYALHWTNRDVRERKMHCRTQILRYMALLEHSNPRLMLGVLQHSVVKHKPKNVYVNFAGNLLAVLAMNRHARLVAASKHMVSLRRTEHRGLIRLPPQGPGVAPLAYVPCWLCRGPCTSLV